MDMLHPQHPPSAESLPASLLERVRENDASAWYKLVSLFSPLVYLWIRKDGVPAADAPDAAQDVFLEVARSLSKFRRDRPGDSFTGWIRTITRRRACDHARARARAFAAHGGSDALEQMANIPDELPSEDPDETASANADLLRRGLDLIRDEFTAVTWQAFEAIALHGRPPRDVADELGLSIGAVYVAKSRVRKRLREELEGLL